MLCSDIIHGGPLCTCPRSLVLTQSSPFSYKFFWKSQTTSLVLVRPKDGPASAEAVVALLPFAFVPSPLSRTEIGAWSFLLHTEKGKGSKGGGCMRKDTIAAAHSEYFPCSHVLMPHQSGPNGFYIKSYCESYLYI